MLRERRSPGNERERMMEIIDPVTGRRKTIEGTSEQLDALKHVADLVETGKNLEVPSAVETALKVEISPYDVLINGLQAGLAVVGERFKCQEAFIPEVLVSARAMKAGIEILKPLLAPTGKKPVGVCVLGTVKGDLHDIGQNLVGIMLESAGFTVYNCGVNMQPEAFLAKAKEVNANLVGMSALLATTMLNQKATIQYFADNGYRDKVRIMSGGAPVSPEFAQEIGADGYASNALAAIELAKTLMHEGWNGNFVNGDEIGVSRAA
ncbi:MAG: corrinoid protein [Rhodospirillales bacterium]|nr:corrinoid protein [Rhodospirillales bacterium]